MRKLFTLIAIIFVSCGNANAEVEKCTIATKYVCTPEECVKKDSSIWILLDFAKEEYRKSDRRSSSANAPARHRSGAPPGTPPRAPPARF